MCVLRLGTFINYLKNLDKCINTKKLHTQANNKNSRMSLTTSPLFFQTKSAFNGLRKEYFKKNINKIETCKEFLAMSKPECIKYLNIKEGTYHIVMSAVFKSYFRDSVGRLPLNNGLKIIKLITTKINQ
jgi:hypothetical protein